MGASRRTAPLKAHPIMDDTHEVAPLKLPAQPVAISPKEAFPLPMTVFPACTATMVRGFKIFLNFLSPRSFISFSSLMSPAPLSRRVCFHSEELSVQ